MSVLRLALLTSREFPQLAPEDQVLASGLEHEGWQVEIAIWDEVRRLEADVAIVRSCWDYHRRPVEFLTALERLSCRVRLYNPHRLLQWNADKAYLNDLARWGVPIVPTVIAGPEPPEKLAGMIAALGWSRVVVKPRVSATAEGLIRLEASAARTAEWPDSPWGYVIQPFVSDIERKGELSMVYLGGAYSHAIHKLPRLGDFRVQAQFGGSTNRVEPTAAQRLVADKAMAALPVPSLYARVDLVGDGDEIRLMELELIEPELFFSLEPASMGRFAEAMERAVKEIPAPSWPAERRA